MSIARPDDDPFDAWLASRGPARPRARVTAAFRALVVGWLAGSAVTWLVEASTGGRAGWGDTLLFDLFIGLFAGGGWLLSVLPFALFASHDSWLFRPVTAPLVGAACGVALLLLEIWVFFDDPPWRMVRGGVDSGAVYLLTVGAVVGAVLWSTYTGWAERRRERAR